MEAPSTRRRSIGHGRVLPPGQRRLDAARPLVRQLTVKAARRLRRAGLVASRLSLWVVCLDAPDWSASTSLPADADDLACLDALSGLWSDLAHVRGRAALIRAGVSFDRVAPVGTAQLCLPFAAPVRRREAGRAVTAAERRDALLASHAVQDDADLLFG